MPIRQDTRRFDGVYCLLFVSIVIRIIRWAMCALCPNGTHDIDRENGERRIHIIGWESTMRFRAERISHLHYFHKENPCIGPPSLSVQGLNITAFPCRRNNRFKGYTCSNRCDALRLQVERASQSHLDRFWINYKVNFMDKYIVEDIWLGVIIT